MMMKTYASGIFNFFINDLAGSNMVKHQLRHKLYNRYGGMQIETDDIRPGCFFYGSDVKIGAGTLINHRCYFENRERIEIGRNCRVAMEVMFCTSTHEIGSSELRGGEYAGKPIKVGDGCWIGTRVIVLPGVTIGDGCVIAAGAVVTKDCKPNSLYAGIPANFIRNLSNDEKYLKTSGL
jgi:maltose O-acetyltransferase